MALKIKDKNRQNFDVIFGKLKSTFSLTENGRLIPNDIFHGHRLEWMLLSIIDFGPNLAPSSQKEILWKALTEVFKNKEYSQEVFIKELTKSYLDHKRKKKKTFRLLITISIRSLPFRRLKLGNAQLIFHGKKFPRKYQTSRDNLIRTKQLDKDELDYLKISVVQDSSNFKDSFWECIEAFEVFRAFLCLELNKAIEVEAPSKQQECINVVKLGEVFTLHEDDGNCIDNDCFWYQKDYQKLVSKDLKSSDLKAIREPLRDMVRLYNKCKIKHQTSLRQALNLYVYAFDERDHHLCFVRAWTVLEKLLCTHMNDTIIKRISVLYEKKIFVIQELECLRTFRNELTHSGRHWFTSEFPCYSIQRFILHLIEFNLKFAGFLKNIQESAELLDNLKLDGKTLQLKDKLITKSLHIIENRENKH